MKSAPVEGRVLAGFVAAMLVLVGMGGYTYWMSEEFVESSRWVSHTQQVRAELAQLYGAISDVESTQRAILLTDNVTFRYEYARFVLEVAHAQQSLSVLIADNPRQLENLKTLSALISRRLDILKQHLATFDNRGRVTAMAELSSDDGIRTMQAIRKLIDRMDEMELNLLTSRNAMFKHDRETTLIGLLGTLAVALSVLAAVFVGIRREMVARGKAERMLQDFATRVTTIVDTVPDGIITIDKQGTIKTLNPAGERLFGYAAVDVVGRSINMLMPKSQRSEHNNYFKNHLDTSQPPITRVGREVVGQRKDGSTFPIYLAVNEMRLDDQLHFVGIVHDLTEEAEAQQSLLVAKERAESANLAKDSFLATMSHEIRTPLTGMLGMLELLSMTTLSKEQRQTFNTAWESSKSLLRIVNDILDWSKIEDGKLELAPRPTSITAILQEVVNTYARVASIKSLVLSHRVDPQLSVTHMADGLRLSQILNNFVSNALKFTQQGEIELCAECLERLPGGERICFSVRDSGIGIAKAVQEGLFQRYRQESADTARMYGGTGLGLAICRRLAELMDGEVGLVSEPGRGSIFSITLILPVTELPVTGVPSIHAEGEQRVIHPLANGGADAPLVLAADDHPINRDLLTQQLALLGLRTETAENGKEALSMWRDGRFALVITDCHMPIMDGYALSRAIRNAESEEHRGRTPIVAWTANAMAQEAEHCEAAGIDGLLVKPANLAQLRSVLAQFLKLAEPDDGGATPLADNTDTDGRAGLIDFSVLREIVADPLSQTQLLYDFQAHIRTDHAALASMAITGNLSDIEGMAHRMKGSCRMVGATQLADACAALEQAVSEGDLAGASEARQAVGERISQLDSYLSTVGRSG
jgi:PAS domain S-box-containing protein